MDAGCSVPHCIHSFQKISLGDFLNPDHVGTGAYEVLMSILHR
jgi:hypothetical protein